LLTSIIRVLESGTVLDSSDLRRKHSELVAKLQSNPLLAKKFLAYNESGQSPEGSTKNLLGLGGKPKPATGVIRRKDAMDGSRYMQCVYVVIASRWIKGNPLTN